MWKDAVWLGVPGDEIAEKQIYHGDMTGRFAYYRCSFTLEEPGTLLADLSAGSRYRLWVNGSPVCSGPCKGDPYRYYYETCDLSEYVRAGGNVLAVQVLWQDPHAVVCQTDERAAIYSVCSPGGGHRLAFEGSVRNAEGETVCNLTTGVADWRVYLEGSYFLKSDPVTEYLGAVIEEIDCAERPGDWKNPGFDAAGWRQAVGMEPVVSSPFMETVGLIKRFPMAERPIPLLYERDAVFVREAGTETGVLESGSVRVPGGGTLRVILDAGVEVNGYPRFFFESGAGSRVSITYLEKFTGENARSKTDAERGEAVGITDRLTLSGGGDVFEPFWYRTFRFVVIQIQAAEDTVCHAPVYRKTGYPLKVVSHVGSTEPWVGQVYDMCVRTLENCMMETYMDCPYYEQNQFPMDTRLQALFCAAVSGDVRLTRKALWDLHSSITPEGLVHGKYPSVYPQIISTFSLFYIDMLEEYYQQTGAIEELRDYLPDVDRILGYYRAHLEESGMVGRLGYWEFVDWQPAWAQYGGVPEALCHGPSTIISLMYAQALQRGRVLMEAAGRPGLGEEYGERCARLLDAVMRLCWDEERGMLREGPGFARYTRHAQSRAVLCGLLTGERARRALCHAMEDEDVLNCTFSTSFEWFRALEKAGLYEKTQGDMACWAALPAQGSTTCPETPGESRSECHAWSALPLYELICVMAGVRMRRGRVEIAPVPSWLADLKGEAVTPAGSVAFSYTREKTGWRYELTLPAGLEGTFVYPDGRREKLSTQAGTCVYIQESERQEERA